jgi:tetratricopeptide (TPR) repeat protein
VTSADSAKLARYLGFLEQDPDNSQLLLDTIGLAMSCGEFAQAEALIDSGLARWPAHAALGHQRGLLALRQGDPATAVALFESLRAMGQQTAAVRYNLAYAHYLQGQFAAARDLLVPLQNEADTVAGAVHLLILCLHQLGELGEARQLAEAALAQNANDAELAGLHALVCLDDDDVAAAGQWAQHCLQLVPEQQYGLVVLGTVLLAQGQTEAAMARFEQVLTRFPANGRAWSGLGLAHLHRQDFPAAEQAFQRATQHMPSHIGTWHAYGWLCLLQQRLDEAEHCFQQGLALDRNFGESYGGLAAVALLKGQPAQAAPLLERARRLAPQGLASRFGELIEAHAAGNGAEVSRILESALAAIPGSSTFLAAKPVKP